MMREALDGESGHVTFVDVGGSYTRPARTMAKYVATMNEQLQRAPRVRLFAEVQYGPTPAEWDEWTAYEAMCNAAYSHLPCWVVCTYNGSKTPDRMLEGVWQTHAEVITDDWQDSPHFEDPAHVMRRLTPAPQPLTGLRSVAPGDDLESFREHLAAALYAESLPPAQALDMIVAASEVAANAIHHGGGVHELRIGEAHGRFVCEISDRGRGFDDPLAGYMPPRNGEAVSGLWVARQLTWRIEFIPAARGFTVRLWL
jgi:anti-sigma regulatory factor (Ser/Thr protein kinase)